MSSMYNNDKSLVYELERKLKEIFGHQNYRNELQKNAVETVTIGNQDVFISMPTGAGKSLCYQLPALSERRNGVTIVISPLIALMVNQLQQMKLLGISSDTLNSTMTNSERERVRNDLCCNKPMIKLLYITPEQASTNSFSTILNILYKNKNLARIVVDEAHCVSQWGHDFRVDYLKLGSIREKFTSVPWVALTATASVQVMNDVFSLLKLRQPLAVFKTSCFRSNLFYDVVFKECINDPYENLKIFALSAFGETWENSSRENRSCGIIYCRTREACEEVSLKLTNLGLLTKAYHAGLKPNERMVTQNAWMTGQVPVIAATISFGMGVDKGSVRFVAHWTTSQSLAGYYQESGRAGRDGRLSKCRIYYSRSDRESILFLLNRDLRSAKSTGEKSKAETAINSFNRVIKYCEEAVCRHVLLSKEFGDNISNCKSCCDVCCKLSDVEHKISQFRATLFTTKTGYKNVSSRNYDNELYGGGKYGSKYEAEQHGDDDDDDDDSYSSDAANKQAGKELTKFIQEEFNRRKKKLESKKNYSKNSHVLKPDSNFIPEVTLDIREMYLLKIHEELKFHYNAVCKNIYPVMQFNDQDLLDCSASRELHLYSTKKNIHMYRREMIEMFKSIRAYTGKSELHHLLQKYDPLKCAAKEKRHKGKKPKEKLYTLFDMMEKHNKMNEFVEKQHSSNFDIKPNQVISSESESSSEEISSELILDDKSYESETPETNALCIEEKCENEFKENSVREDCINNVTKTSQIQPAIKYFFENKTLLEKEKTSEHNLENDLLLQNNNRNNTQKCKQTKKRQQNGKRKINELEANDKSDFKKHTKIENNKVNSGNLQTAVDLVRKYLDPKYKEKKITKDMFKIVCRKISHKLVDSNKISKIYAKQAVKQLFDKCEVIKSETDIFDSEIKLSDTDE